MAEHIPDSNEESFFNSFNCVDAYFDEPGDTTVRPCDPRFLSHASAERAKIQQAMAAQNSSAHASSRPRGPQ